MDSSLNNFISDQSHVAQQSRREKLRVQHCSPSISVQHAGNYASGLEDMSNTTGFLYHSASASSGVANISSTFCNNNQNEDMENQASIAVSSVNMGSPTADSLLKTRIENNLENCGVWKNVSANSIADHWNTVSIGGSRENNNSGIVMDISALEMRSKQNITGYGQSQFHCGDVNFTSPLLYHNTSSNGVTTAVMGLQPSVRLGRNSTEDNENVHLVTSYGYQSDIGWNAEMSSLHSRANQVVANSQSRGLSLSLCSYQDGTMMSDTQYGNSHIPESISLQTVASIAFQDSKPCIPNFARIPSAGQGNPIQELVETSTNYRSQTGPLGPFTGYATILKSSQFLRPAQQLLDDYCGVIGRFATRSTKAAASDSDTGEFGDLSAAVNSIMSDAVIEGNVLNVSTATPQKSEEILEGAKCSSIESLQHDYQAKKAKLLYMLEEVSRRYKQYSQQMQMVVSAFESVAGLSGATPYISSALESVSRHFNHLKNSISDQLRHIKTFLGEDFSLPNSGIIDKGKFNNKRLKFSDHNYQKNNSGGSNMGILAPQQHIWRPQRGLPERAVSVLRAWLFEHFLHPYPTDTDKHMLATQTGLTRSQVSNWFINARVRLWKPMVEEVHMLETKGAVERNKNAAENNNVSTNGDDVQLKADYPLNKMVGSSTASVNLECPTTDSLYETREVCIANSYDHGKQSHVEMHNMSRSSINENFLDVAPYHQTGNEISGLGSISLTLGLRQSAEQLHRLEGSQLPSYLRQKDHLRQHFGGHATYEYTG